jgi:hypothetical protein
VNLYGFVENDGVNYFDWLGSKKSAPTGTAPVPELPQPGGPSMPILPPQSGTVLHSSTCSAKFYYVCRPKRDYSFSTSCGTRTSSFIAEGYGYSENSWQWVAYLAATAEASNEALSKAAGKCGLCCEPSLVAQEMTCQNQTINAIGEGPAVVIPPVPNKKP